MRKMKEMTEAQARKYLRIPKKQKIPKKYVITTISDLNLLLLNGKLEPMQRARTKKTKQAWLAMLDSAE